MNGISALWRVVRRETAFLTSRPMYLVAMVAVPLAMALFLMSLLSPGLPVKVPAAVVDMDHTNLSRTVVRNLSASEMVDVKLKALDFNDAQDAVARGEVMGFFVIPENFERDALANNGAALPFYSDLTYFVPGTLVFKGFKTLAVTTSGGIVQTGLVNRGAPGNLAKAFLQPMAITSHPLNNPYLNYGYYLGPSFIPGVLELMIFLVTIWSMTHEIKTGESRRWLAEARGDIWVAITGKLIPQTAVFLVVGFAINVWMFCYMHYPMQCPLWHLMLGMALMVVASQSVGVFVSCILPNPRLALSIGSLLGILAFSIAAFSFPVSSMYGSIAIFSYLLPVRYYFLIYIDQGLNGIPMYFSREYYAALVAFVIPAVLAAPLLRRRCLRPIYVP